MTTAPRPDAIHGAGSQMYRFDRIGADEISWFRSEYNGTEIPSAPLRLTHSVGTSDTAEYGYAAHTATTPEPSAMAYICLAFALIGVSRIMRWGVQG
jgi:hypothetical protein